MFAPTAIFFSTYAKKPRRTQRYKLKTTPFYSVCYYVRTLNRRLADRPQLSTMAATIDVQG